MKINMKKTQDGECEINFTNMTIKEFDELRILLFTLAGNSLGESERKQLSAETLMNLKDWKAPEVVNPSKSTK